MVLQPLEMAPLVTRHEAGRAAMSLRRRVAIHLPCGTANDSPSSAPSRRSAASGTRSFDNALAETLNSYYKAELIRGPTRRQPWKTVEDVELATLGWVHWHNTRRLHGYLGDQSPVEYEQTFYAAMKPTSVGSESHNAGLHRTRGRLR
jgi:transposase InsO family protein